MHDKQWVAVKIFLLFKRLASKVLFSPSFQRSGTVFMEKFLGKIPNIAQCA